MAAEGVPGRVPESINCYQCGGLIDLGEQTAFTHVDCPRCGALSVVPIQFGNFLLMNPLGVGGMGTVYKAMDLSLNRYLALKILRKKMASKPEFIQSFSREARAAAAVNHPNIAQVYSFGEHENQYYLAMELLERGSLDDRITTLGKIPEKDVLDIGRAVAAGLRAAESRSLLHRDIKPGNILFNDDSQPKIVDFGLARASNQAQASNEPIWGTPYYIAPEKLRGQPEDLRSDIYSLGATLYHALAGRPPFDAATASEVVTKHATQPAYSLKTYAPDIQPATAHVIGRMLSKNPAERYQTYDELIHDLDEAIASFKFSTSKKVVVSSKGEKIPVTSVIATFATLIVCAVVVWFVWANRAGIFHLEQPAPPANTGPDESGTTGDPGLKPTTVTPLHSAVTPEIDFTEDTAWVKAWNQGMIELAQGRYQEAFMAFDSAKRLAGSNRPVVQWLCFYESLTSLAADRMSISLASLVKGRNPSAPREVPAAIHTGNFIDPLIFVMLGDMPVATLREAERRMPPWAVALSQMTAGFKALQEGRLADSIERFHAYVALPRDEKYPWVYALQPLADRLTFQSQGWIDLLAEVDRLAAEGQPQAANAKLQAALRQPVLSVVKPLLEKRVASLQAALAKLEEQTLRAQAEAERVRQEKEAQLRARAEEETKLVEALQPEIQPLLQRYDFNGARTKYEQFDATVTTETGHQLVQRYMAAMKALHEFKQQLTADFARKPYSTPELRTRRGEKLTGELHQADANKLFFKTQYGELFHTWTELPPSELIKLGVFYAKTFAASEDNAKQAQRYLQLTVFADRFGAANNATAFIERALKLNPALSDQADRLLGAAAAAAPK